MRSDPPLSAGTIESLLEGTAYRPSALLGRGSMGEVWSVRHELIDREFALKVLHHRHLGNHQLIERIRLEARAMAALDHPNVVEVVDFWVSPDGRPCLIMEMLTGQRLDREILRRRRLPGPEVVRIGRQALSALAAAHGIGLVHRDIKPENLFLHESRGQMPALKLLDFGLARVLGGAIAGRNLQPLDLTRTGTVLGSPRFMSPEALRGERVGPLGDIYSLGVVLYVCLLGLHSNFDMATLPVFHPPSKLGAIGCTPRLDTIVLRAVESDPCRRFPSATAFLTELEAPDVLVGAVE
ncbi:MAG TPA: serine/threonine-protein kinase [Polyangiaceae bacterium]